MLLLRSVAGWLVLSSFVFLEGRSDEFRSSAAGLEYHKNHSKEIVKDGSTSDKRLAVCYREVAVPNMQWQYDFHAVKNRPTKNGKEFF